MNIESNSESRIDLTILIKYKVVLESSENCLLQDNAYRAADGEPPLDYEDIEKLMKDILIGKIVCFVSLDSYFSLLRYGVSGDVPSQVRPPPQWTD